MSKDLDSEKKIDKFEKLPPAERRRKIQYQPRPGTEIPLLNDNRGLFVYGSSAERARKASPTFRRKARRMKDGGYRIGRDHLGALLREFRAAHCFGRVYGPAAAFCDGRIERISHEERAAIAFGAWAVKRKKREAKAVSFWRKLSNTLERAHNAARGRGFQTLEDIFERAWSGRMAQRFNQSTARPVNGAGVGREADLARLPAHAVEAAARAGQYGLTDAEVDVIEKGSA